MFLYLKIGKKLTFYQDYKKVTRIIRFDVIPVE